MIGKRIRHYEIEQLLGKGGMGVVYKARDVRLGRPVALKVLKDEIAGNPDRKRRFLQEARSASAISHPCVAQVYDVDEVDGALYLALEFVEGQTVRQLISSRELDLLGAVEIGIQVAEGLAQAHAKGIVHRDIKSDNIMVTPDGHVKILDFGLAKFLEGGDRETTQASTAETLAQTEVGTVMGTVAYMSPEQARGKVIDHRSDIFSLGVVVYEMVMGELPFKGQSPLDTMHAIAFEEVRPVTVVRRDLPADFQRILSRCMRKRPEDRYQDIGAFLKDLRELKESLESGNQRPVGLRDRIRDFMEWVRFSLPFGLGGTLLTLAVLGLIIYLIASQAELGTLIVVVLIGLPVYRYIRNRKARMVKRFIAKASKLPEVKAISVRGDSIEVAVEGAKAALFIRLNSLVDALNRKIFYGDPLSVSFRDVAEDDSFQSFLREPGVRYVRRDVLQEDPRPESL